MNLWKMREEKMPKEQRQLGLYLTGTMVVVMLFGIGGGMVIPSKITFSSFATFGLIVVMGIGFSILMAFGAARVIYEECIKEGCKNEP